MFYHVPNGGKRDAKTAAHMKALGVKPGVPDLCLPIPSHPYPKQFHALYIEMKAPDDTGVISNMQWKWMRNLFEFGSCPVIASSWTQAVHLTKMYLGIEKRGPEWWLLDEPIERIKRHGLYGEGWEPDETPGS